MSLPHAKYYLGDPSWANFYANFLSKTRSRKVRPENFCNDRVGRRSDRRKPSCTSGGTRREDANRTVYRAEAQWLARMKTSPLMVTFVKGDPKPRTIVQSPIAQTLIDRGLVQPTQDGLLGNSQTYHLVWP
jgi:hypothetical protein